MSQRRPPRNPKSPEDPVTPSNNRERYRPPRNPNKPVLNDGVDPRVHRRQTSAKSTPPQPFTRASKVSSTNGVKAMLPCPERDVDDITTKFESLKFSPSPIYMDVEDIISRQRIQEKPSWIACSPRRRDVLMATDMKKEWLVCGPTIKWTDIPDDFFDAKKLKSLQAMKIAVMDPLTEPQKRNLRIRANPYEDLKGAFFVCRDGPKLASLDKMFGFTISGEIDTKKRVAKTPVSDVPASNASRNDPPYYFVDIGGAPGGYTDYLLWRKGYYNAKGFVSNDRFYVHNTARMLPLSAGFLSPHRASHGDAYLDCIPNIDEFIAHVQTTTPTVDFVGAYSCYSPDGCELSQEIQHHKLFLGNCVTGLSLLRIGSGNMLLRVFDLFTPVSVGILYCLYLSFAQVAVVKPVTCRPGNSEQFVYCEKLTHFGANIIKDYLKHVLDEWDNLPAEDDVSSIVPTSTIRNDTKFFEHFVQHNESAVDRQIKYLQLYGAFAKDRRLQTPNGADIRKLALIHWELGPYPKKGVMEMVKLSAKDIVAMKSDSTFDLSNFQSTLQMVPQCVATDYSTFSATQCVSKTCKFALAVTDGKGNLFYLMDPANGFISTCFQGPPFSVFLIEMTLGTFSGKLDEETIVIHDAGLLANDDVSTLPLTHRLKCAEKFAATATFGSPGQAKLKFDVAEHAELCQTDVMIDSHKHYRLIPNDSNVKAAGDNCHNSTFWKNISIKNAWVSH
uniref:Cap-specific mRNA (nucleoside-2'-O-)-methyltransferase 1 n=1 Tax=Panagrellus redivivus TaxID=6233 RepID=A0A7E4VEP1_PANRE